MMPFRFVIGRRYANQAQLNTVLLVDAARWPEIARPKTAFLVAYRRACRLAWQYLQHCALLKKCVKTALLRATSEPIR